MQDEIITKATEEMRKHSYLRYGQAVFNTAFLMYPIEVNKLRGTELDCFYRDDKVDDFLRMVETLTTQNETTN